MQWDDLRFVLAVHRAGSLTGAARTLNVSHVTVFRRIEGIEEVLGVRLFDRTRRGYVATPIATEIVQQAELVEDQINSLERRIWRKDSQISGTVRLTTTDTIACTILPGMLARLRDKHPQLTLEVMISDQTFNITKRDADIAIRHTKAPPEMLVGHCLTPVSYAIYGDASFSKRRSARPIDFSSLPWISPDDSPSEYRFLKWLRDHGHDSRVVLRCNSFVPMAAAVRSSAGVAILSCFTAETLGGLTRLSAPIKEVEWQYWILTHPELRGVARVATVYAFLRDAFAELKPLFTGLTTPGAAQRPTRGGGRR